MPAKSGRIGGFAVICAFTGHRPEKLPWQSEEDPRCAALKEQILQAVVRAYEAGARRFACGMARGCDFYFAEAVLFFRQSHTDVFLDAWIPCPSQPDGWCPGDKSRYDRLLRQCDRVYLNEDHYSEGCMLRRNRAMLEKAGRLISVYSGSFGGTGQTVAYARSLGLPVDAIWL